MVVFIAVFGGLLLSLFIYLSIFAWLVSYKKKFEMIDWFLVAIATFNGLGFGFVMWATYEGNNTYIWTPWIMSYDSTLTIIYLITNIIFIAAVFYGWQLAKSIFNSPTIQMKKNETVSGKQQFFLKKLKVVAWLMLFIAIITYWIYTKPYGGFIGLLAYSRAIRSGINVIQNKYSFFQRFGSFAFFSSYVFFGFLIDKDNKNLKKKSSFIGFIISLLFSIYVLYSWVGRIAFVVYLLTFLLGYTLYTYKSIFGFIRKIITLFITGLIAIVLFDKILKRTYEGVGVIKLFTKELSFPIASYVVQFNLQEYRWFKDIIAAPLYILPMKIWSGILNIETASTFNTIAFLGARKGEAGITGSIPVDMLTFSMMQGSILGIVLVGLIWGVLLFFLERLINCIPVKSVKTVLYSYMILNVVVLSVLYGDPKHIIVRNFDTIMGLIILWFVSKIRYKIVYKR
ncbi:O-antigen polymerase [Caloranaerobacter sp. DY30410]|uniref:O-antigen polymerase n=1 Tax=Caloranaerobacter sp. DY30410 TaxID=3238305 RepID=UPI003CFFEE8D